MQRKSAAEVRELFLKFFESRGHRRVKSSSLVPHEDPTLLFTNAGMNQFKDVFTGKEKRDYTRAASSQKCVRAGGKHNDLDNVGFTARHHTFFEMLGNFSFGDYFKKEAIRWAWELVTGDLGIPRERLAVTVFRDDDEAFALWRSEADVPGERIHRLGEKDNFWAMGETGPCGPCSEIHFHLGNDLPCAEEAHGRACQGIACECDRWLEIWNLVFMQFERDASGVMKPLPRPSIDTGAGLERLAAVVQGVRSNYDTDLLRPLVELAAQLAGTKYGADPALDPSMRVVADHARATAFLVADGVLPGNEGRGYVLRRIMRRAIRHGKKLGLEKPFLHAVAAKVVETMSGAYPELADGRALIHEVALNEEEGFRRTLDKGLKVIEEEIARLGREKVLAGEVVFKLHDTYGFPPDLTEIVAQEKGVVAIDMDGYRQRMEEQRARGAFAGSGEKAVEDLYKNLRAEHGESEFLGYSEVVAHGKVLALIVEGQRVHVAQAGTDVQLVTDRTSFYGEQGGQVGDTGWITGPRGRLAVNDTKRPAGLIVHNGRVTEGSLHAGDAVELVIDHARRQKIRANHSATHLLHRALREVLGEHVKQAGSVVAPDYLTFDYHHFSAPSDEELEKVEARVNELVAENAEARTEVLPFEEARATGAIALFGEKYGDRVRVMHIGPSVELCGGTHVRRSGDIGMFKILGEGAISAGVRRIRAASGLEALAAVHEEERSLRKAAGALKAAPRELGAKAEAAVARVRELEKELESLRMKLATAKSVDLAEQVREIKGVKVLAVQSEVGDAKALRDLADKLRDKIRSGVVALGAEKDGKALLLVAVTPDLVGRYKAGDLVKEMAREVGGAGGGKPDLAQAGGSDPSRIPQALEKIYTLI